MDSYEADRAVLDRVMKLARTVEGLIPSAPAA